jgi:hypothetical protein
MSHRTRSRPLDSSALAYSVLDLSIELAWRARSSSPRFGPSECAHRHTHGWDQRAGKGRGCGRRALLPARRFTPRVRPLTRERRGSVGLVVHTHPRGRGFLFSRSAPGEGTGGGSGSIVGVSVDRTQALTARQFHQGRFLPQPSISCGY